MPLHDRCDYRVISNQRSSKTEWWPDSSTSTWIVLRTFVIGTDLGSFAKAADRLGRSPSAVSLHLRKLEEQIGQPLVRKQGRGLVLTEAGETLMGYARRILDLNDEARLALGGLAKLEGWCASASLKTSPRRGCLRCWPASSVLIRRSASRPGSTGAPRWPMPSAPTR